LGFWRLVWLAWQKDICLIEAEGPLLRFHNQIDAERSFNETTTPAKPNVRVGS
jgi:hypothetical protein